MLPALVNHLDAVTIGVEDSRCEVARAVMQARAKRTVVCGPRRNSGHAFSDKTDARGTRVRTALPQPERHPTRAQNLSNQDAPQGHQRGHSQRHEECRAVPVLACNRRLEPFKINPSFKDRL